MYGGFWMSFATIFLPGSGVIDAYGTNTDELNSALGIYLWTWFIVTFLLLYVLFPSLHGCGGARRFGCHCCVRRKAACIIAAQFYPNGQTELYSSSLVISRRSMRSNTAVARLNQNTEPTRIFILDADTTPTLTVACARILRIASLRRNVGLIVLFFFLTITFALLGAGTLSAHL